MLTDLDLAEGVLREPAALVEHILDEELRSPSILLQAKREIERCEAARIAQQLRISLVQVLRCPGLVIGHALNIAGERIVQVGFVVRLSLNITM